jgi:hypothetical protein
MPTKDDLLAAGYQNVLARSRTGVFRGRDYVKIIEVLTYVENTLKVLDRLHSCPQRPQAFA